MSPKSVFATRVTKSVHLQACMGLKYWQLLCLAVERSWLVLAMVDDFSPCIFALMDLENIPLTFWRTPFLAVYLGSYQSRQAVAGQEP